ncbi:MAG: sulfatase-like hydrolase/transferase [Bacteroidales bacterium]
MARRSRPEKPARSAGAATPAASRRPPAPPARTPRSYGRAVIGLAIVLTAIGVAVAGRLLVTRHSNAPGPIVLISIDTLRADHLPAYGYHGVHTPNVDALAADGVMFEHAYAHVPQTLPSHVSILTGELPFEHGVRDNVGFVMKRDQRTLPGMLRDRGYATGGFASAFILRKETGIGEGFDVYDDETPAPTADVSFSSLRRDGSDTIAAAERWLAARSSPRFFLFVHLYEPHRPYHPPERYAHYPNPYDGAVAYTDELVGRLLADLKSRGLYDNATIVFTADHGEGLGDHGEREHGVFLYDSTIRVPLIVKLPRDRDAGRRIVAHVQHIDLVPTLLDLAGAPIPRDLRGVSLRQAMDGSRRVADRGIYSETLYTLYHFGWSPLYALTDPRYRFIKAPTPELYDLARDPAELHNVQVDRSATASSLQAALDTLVVGRDIDRPLPTSGTDNARFQALGYIGSAHVPAAASKGGLPDPKDKVAALEQYRQAVDLRSEGRLPEAVAAYRRLLADNPSMVDVWAQLAAVLTTQGKNGEAADALEHAVALDPEVAENQLTLASTLVPLGRLDEAAAHARRALGKSPGVAHELLAKVAYARGNRAEAQAEAASASAADPTLVFPLYLQGVLARDGGQLDQALALFGRAAAAAKARQVELADLHMAIADTLARLGRDREAETEFKEELARFPRNDQARVRLAMLYRAQGRTDDANTMLTEMLRASPTPASYVLAARTYRIIGNADAARDVVVRGLQQFPGNPELRAMR